MNKKHATPPRPDPSQGRTSPRSPAAAGANPILNEAAQRARRGDLAGARALLEPLTAGDAPDVEALQLLGGITVQQGRPDLAEPLLRRVLALQPGHAVAHSNLGFALSRMNRDAEAVEHYDIALAADPAFVDALVNRGVALNKLKRYDEAIASQRRALELRPDHAGALSNLGMVLANLNRHAEAIACHEAARRIEPDSAAAQYNLGHALLVTGDFARGWPQFAWRWRANMNRLTAEQMFWLGTEARHGRFDLPHGVRCAINLPFWDGRPMRDSLLVWPEKGLGELIMFASMLTEVRQRVGRLTLITDPRLIPLFQRSFPDIEAITLDAAQRRNDFQWQLPMGDLCGLFRPHTEDFLRHRKAYLRADPQRAAALKPQLPAGRRCGLAWFSKNAEFGGSKSLGPEPVRALLGAGGWQFIDLQYGDTRAIREQLQRDTGVAITRVDSVDNFHDLEGLAALIDNCDLIVTVSTAAAHIAGAMGKPVFLMLPHAEGRFWYWQAMRDDALWYPHMRLFRQTAAGDWAGVVERVVAAMNAF